LTAETLARGVGGCDARPLSSPAGPEDEKDENDMMLKRTSKAVWRGTGAEGSGMLDTQSGALHEHPYSTKMRFQSEDGKAGTNPEELLAAAHAGCFAMALSFALTAAGHPPEELRVSSTFTIEKEGVHWLPKSIVLTLEGKVPGVDEAKFLELAEGAKKGCPISRALAAVEISLNAKLVSA
jgi:osmotically inducible protein OsmC